MLLDAMKYDRRIVERNLRKGMLTRQEYDKYLHKLPDAAENSMLIPAAMETSEPTMSVATTVVVDDDDDL